MGERWAAEGNAGVRPTYFPLAPNVAGAQRVKVAAGQDASGTDISLIAGRVVRISGTAHTSQGTPAAGQTVSLGQSLRSPTGFMSMWSMDSSKVGPDGTFSLKNVAPGEYNLNLRVPAIGDAPAESAALTLSVAGTDIEGVVLTASTGGSMTGRVAFDGNVAAPQPATQFRVVVRPVNRDGPNTGGASPDNGRVRPDWGFTLTAVMGANRIGIATLPPGWRSIR